MVGQEPKAKTAADRIAHGLGIMLAAVYKRCDPEQTRLQVEEGASELADGIEEALLYIRRSAGR